MISKWTVYSLQEASAKTGLATETLQELTGSGRLPHTDDHGQIRVLGLYLQRLMISCSEETAFNKKTIREMTPTGKLTHEIGARTSKRSP